MPEWFEDWFNSRYYPILYQKRNDEEAQLFIRNLLSHLRLKAGSRILDLGCGRGRHSVYLNSLGFDVTGADLSTASIADAKKYENETLRFIVHDMRNTLEAGAFDLVLNLFTSFGYFEDTSENLAVLQAAHMALTVQGLIVVDFFNAEKVARTLVAAEHKETGDIRFDIRRTIRDGFVVKDIHITDGAKEFDFTERVQLLTRRDFGILFEKSGFHEAGVFGDYNLGTFDAENSDRLILIASKA